MSLIGYGFRDSMHVAGRTSRGMAVSHADRTGERDGGDERAISRGIQLDALRGKLERPRGEV
jgi:hypothetical protein